MANMLTNEQINNLIMMLRSRYDEDNVLALNIIIDGIENWNYTKKTYASMGQLCNRIEGQMVSTMYRATEIMREKQQLLHKAKIIMSTVRKRIDADVKNWSYGR